MTGPIAVRRRPRRGRLVLVLDLVVAVVARVGIWFSPRGRMRMIAAALVDDPRAGVVYTQTSQQAYLEYRACPDLVARGAIDGKYQGLHRLPSGFGCRVSARWGPDVGRRWTSFPM